MRLPATRYALHGDALALKEATIVALERQPALKEWSAPSMPLCLSFSLEPDAADGGGGGGGGAAAAAAPNGGGGDVAMKRRPGQKVRMPDAM